jgi:hypothetical protein
MNVTVRRSQQLTVAVLGAFAVLIGFAVRFASVAHATPRAGPGPPGEPSASPAAGPAGGRAWLAGPRFDWLEHWTCSHPRQVMTYQPGSTLRNLVRARQRTCSFPGCRRPAARGDLDHTVPYDQGGRTCECKSVASVPDASPGQAGLRLDPDPARTRSPDLDHPG